LPNVLRHGPYRIYFFSHEGSEPAHVHVDRETMTVKFWLKPVVLAKNIGFSPKELRKIKAIVDQHETEFIEAWNEYFSK